MKKYFVALILGIFPTKCVSFIADFFGHKISPKAKIGFSLILCNQLCMGDDAVIGNWNIIVCRRVLMRAGSSIKYLNLIKGPVNIRLSKNASIGNRNTISRAPIGVVLRTAELRLGELSIITGGHKIDCTKSIVFGDFSILAGFGSQIWTHGYVHSEKGADRYRIDGTVRIGSNVYVGSRVIITGGVRISDKAIVGAGAVVAKNLEKAVMYVSSSLRELPKPADPHSRNDLEQMDSNRMVEVVFQKLDEK